MRFVNLPSGDSRSMIGRRSLLVMFALVAVFVVFRIRLFFPEVTQATSVPITVNEPALPIVVEAPKSAPQRQMLSRAADVLPISTTLPDSVASTIGAKHIIVMDSRTGRVLADRLADEAYPMASLTKLLASLVIVDHVKDWKELVQILPEDLREGEAVVHEGERLELYDLLAVTLIRSSNTGIMALGRSIGFTSAQLVERMNALAREKGWTTVMVTDPTGLTPTTVGSAHDIARMLAEALGRNEIGNILGQSQYEWSIYSADHKPLQQHSTISTNELIHPNANTDVYDVVGGKTGYIPDSGYNVAVEAVNSQKYRLIAVVVGAETFERRFVEADRLLRWAFSLLPTNQQSL